MTDWKIVPEFWCCHKYCQKNLRCQRKILFIQLDITQLICFAILFLVFISIHCLKEVDRKLFQSRLSNQCKAMLDELFIALHMCFSVLLKVFLYIRRFFSFLRVFLINFWLTFVIVANFIIFKGRLLSTNCIHYTITFGQNIYRISVAKCLYTRWMVLKPRYFNKFLYSNSRIRTLSSPKVELTEICIQFLCLKYCNTNIIAGK